MTTLKNRKQRKSLVKKKRLSLIFLYKELGTRNLSYKNIKNKFTNRKKFSLWIKILTGIQRQNALNMDSPSFNKSLMDDTNVFLYGDTYSPAIQSVRFSQKGLTNFEVYSRFVDKKSIRKSLLFDFKYFRYIYEGGKSNFLLTTMLSAKKLSPRKKIEFLFTSLENRLDVAVFRMFLGFVNSIRQSKDFIQKGFVLVNGRLIVDPKYKLRLGDAVSFNQKYFFYDRSMYNRAYVHNYRSFLNK